MNEPKCCPKCDGYMHRCEPYTQVPQDKGGGVRGCMAQAPSIKRHPEGNWWICLFCDYLEPVESAA